MLRFLNRRERGVSDPLEFYRAETTRRVYNIRLSDYDVEKLFQGSVNTLDLDLIEKRYLLAGGADGYIVIYDVNSVPGREKERFASVGTVALNNRHRHKFSVETVNWYPLDTGMFTSSGTDCLLKIWDTNRLKPADEYQFSGIVYNHHMSPIATRHCLIAVASKSASVKLVDLKSGSATHGLKGHGTSVYTVKWSPCNEFMVATGGADCKIFLWDIRNAKGSLLKFDQYNGVPPKNSSKLTGITAHTSGVNGLQFSSDGLFLISCGNDNTVHLWSTATGENMCVDYGRVVNSLKKTLQFAVSDGCSSDVIFMPNEAVRGVDVFNMTSGDREYTLTGHYLSVNSCLFHPDKQELYTAASDRNILVWRPNLKTSVYKGVKAVERRTSTKVLPTHDNVEQSNHQSEFKTSHAKVMKAVANGVNQELSGNIANPTVTSNVPSVTADSWSSDEES